jgi:hypothetical protein
MLQGRREVDAVDLFALIEERPTNPWMVRDQAVHTSAELMVLVERNLAETFGLRATSTLLPPLKPAKDIPDALFTCVDGSDFATIVGFIEEKFRGRVHVYHWAGSATSHIAPLEVRDLAAQVEASGVRNVHIMNHYNCLGHGGADRLGGAESQLAYHRGMVLDYSPWRIDLQKYLPGHHFHFYYATRTKGGIIDLGSWYPVRDK